jgi:type VI secretion system secreted protein Hcp
MNPRPLPVFAVAVSCAFGLASTTSWASEIYANFEGSKSGIFPGEALAKGHEKDSRIEAMDWEVVSPRDAATGMATGKRQHRPLRFTKTVGAASGYLLDALIRSESLKGVTFSFASPSADGRMVAARTIKLTNASVASYKVIATAATAKDLEEVTLTYESIEVSDGKKVVVDSVSTR